MHTLLEHVLLEYEDSVPYYRLLYRLSSDEKLRDLINFFCEKYCQNINNPALFASGTCVENEAVRKYFNDSTIFLSMLKNGDFKFNERFEFVKVLSDFMWQLDDDAIYIYSNALKKKLLVTEITKEKLTKCVFKKVNKKENEIVESAYIVTTVDLHYLVNLK